jgi:hypothetical protein
LNFQKFVFDARYTLGLTNIVDVPGGTVDTKNTNIALSVGMMF